MNKRIWMEKEDNYIKDNFGKVTYTEMAKYLDCSIMTVQKRAEALGLDVKRRKSNRWSEEEIELLKEMAPKYLNKTIAKKLERPVQEVNKKARNLGIELIFKRPVWKKWMINYLKDNINKMSLRKIEKELNVSYYQIMEEIDNLGIEYKNNRWSKEEEQILTNLSSKVYIREIAKVINRSEGAVVAKAKTMGLEYITLKREFSKEELDFIKTNWGGIQ